MELADIAEKISNNARLTREESAFWKLSFRQIQLNSSYIAGLQNGRSVVSAENINGNFTYPPTGIAVRLTKNIDLTVPNSGTMTFLDFETEYYDDLSMWDTGTPSKIFIKKTGKYQVSANSLWGSGGTGSYQHLFIGTYNTSDVLVGGLNGYLPSSGAILTIRIFDEITIQSGYYLKVGVRQESATTPTLYAASVTVRLIRPDDSETG